MLIRYSELESHDKAIIVERLAKRFGSRQMYIDDWLQDSDPTVDQLLLELADDDIVKLEAYLSKM
jgi:hypothetical protein